MTKRGKPIERKSTKRQELKTGSTIREVDVEYYVPEGLGVTYVDNLNAIHTSNIFILTFFQVEPPIVMGSNQSVDVVSSRAIAQLAVTPDDMERFILALQNNLDLYKTTISNEG